MFLFLDKTMKNEYESNRRLLIIGAGGHGRVVYDVAKQTTNYQEITFLDDAFDGSVEDGIIDKASNFSQYLDSSDFFVAIGAGKIRKRYVSQLLEANANLISMRHPSSVISESVKIGRGVVVMAGVVVNCNTKIEDGVILNTCSSIDHDCIIGAYSHVAVGARLCGTVHIGDGCFIGANSTVVNNVSICGYCLIGAGGVVVKDLQEPGVYYGAPAVLHVQKQKTGFVEQL